MLIGLALLATGAAASSLGALVGVGGGIVIVPALTLGFGLPVREAVAVSLVAILATSLAGSARYLRRGWIDTQLVVTLALATTLGAVAGGFLAGVLAERVVAAVFTAVLLYTAAAAAPGRAHTAEGEPVVFHGRPVYRVRKLGLGLTVSGVAGLLSGLLGIGGGAIQVPVMAGYMGVPFKVAVATSSMMLGITAAASAVVYYGRGDILREAAGWVSLGALLGAPIGAWLAQRLPALAVRRTFFVVAVLTAVQMLFGRVF